MKRERTKPTIEDVDRALKNAARLAADNPAFLPVFERVEKIKDTQDASLAALRRAQALIA